MRPFPVVLRRRITGLGMAACLTAPLSANATPSSTVWTNMTPDIQGYGVLHIGVDNYFTVFRKAEDGGGSFTTDAGLTLGVLPMTKFQMEVGVDFLESSDYPIFFNAKAGSPEGVLFGGSPALYVGVFNLGTESGVTNQNVFHLDIGESIPKLGRFSAGPYIGNGDLLINGQGDEENTGFMVAFDRGFWPANTDQGSFNRFVLAADYASGNNALGGGAVGVYYNFHPDISLLTGPVWFNDENINGKWKWTIQLDANRLVFGH